MDSASASQMKDASAHELKGLSVDLLDTDEELPQDEVSGQQMADKKISKLLDKKARKKADAALKHTVKLQGDLSDLSGHVKEIGGKVEQIFTFLAGQPRKPSESGELGDMMQVDAGEGAGDGAGDAAGDDHAGGPGAGAGVGGGAAAAAEPAVDEELHFDVPTAMATLDETCNTAKVCPIEANHLANGSYDSASQLAASVFTSCTTTLDPSSVLKVRNSTMDFLQSAEAVATVNTLGAGKLMALVHSKNTLPPGPVNVEVAEVQARSIMENVCRKLGYPPALTAVVRPKPAGAGAVAGAAATAPAAAAAAAAAAGPSGSNAHAAALAVECANRARDIAIRTETVGKACTIATVNATEGELLPFMTAQQFREHLRAVSRAALRNSGLSDSLDDVTEREIRQAMHLVQNRLGSGLEERLRGDDAAAAAGYHVARGKTPGVNSPGFKKPSGGRSADRGRGGRGGFGRSSPSRGGKGGNGGRGGRGGSGGSAAAGAH